MNPMTNVKNIQKLNKLELEVGATSKTSWHNQYRDSAWVFIGGLPYDLSEGDVLAVFSQYGEIVNLNLVRDKTTGKSKGFAFLCYEDQRSTILAVDNLNSFKILGRTLRVDHCENYRKPKETGEEDDLTQQLRAHGCAPKTPSASEGEEEDSLPAKKIKKEKKEKKKKKDKKKERKKKKAKVKSESESSDSDYNNNPSHDASQPVRVKEEKIDPGYEKYATNHNRGRDSSKGSPKIKKEPTYRTYERNSAVDSVKESRDVKDKEDRTDRNKDDRRNRDYSRRSDNSIYPNESYGFSRDFAHSRSRNESYEHSRDLDKQYSNGDRRDRREEIATKDRDNKREADRNRSRNHNRNSSQGHKRDSSRDHDRSRYRDRSDDFDSRRDRDRQRR